MTDHRTTPGSPGSRSRCRAQPAARSPGGRSSSRISSTRPESARRTARRSTATMSPIGTRPSCNARSTAGATIVGKGNLPEFAWGVLGANPWYGTVHNPLHPGKTTGGSSRGMRQRSRQGSSSSGSEPTPAARSGCPRPRVESSGLKSQWGLIPLDGVFPLCPSLDTVGPMGRTVEDVALLWSVLAETAVPEPRLDGLTVGLLRRAPDLGDGRETETSDAAEEWVADLERLGARVVESAIPAAQADTWPLFLHEAAASHRETFPSRADEYAFTIRPKLEAAQLVQPEAVAAAREALAVWRRYEPEVDLYVCPCYAIEPPAEDADELDVRLPLLVVPSLGQPDRLGRPCDREHAVRRARRSHGSRSRSGVGASVESTAVRRASIAISSRRPRAHRRRLREGRAEAFARSRRASRRSASRHGPTPRRSAFRATRASR